MISGTQLISLWHLYTIILDDSWVSTKEFLGTDSSEEEEENEVVPVPNEGDVNSSTGTLNSPGKNVDMYHTATVENFKTIEKDLVVSVGYNSDTNFSDSKKTQMWKILITSLTQSKT